MKLLLIIGLLLLLLVACTNETVVNVEIPEPTIWIQGYNDTHIVCCGIACGNLTWHTYGIWNRTTPDYSDCKTISNLTHDCNNIKREVENEKRRT